ncbi:MAG: hypothetical protein AABW49_04235 [Nanoarchaeota archaeon]
MMYELLIMIIGSVGLIVLSLIFLIKVKPFEDMKHKQGLSLLLMSGLSFLLLILLEGIKTIYTNLYLIKWLQVSWIITTQYLVVLPVMVLLLFVALYSLPKET